MIYAYMNNKDADQPVHQCCASAQSDQSLCFCCLDSKMPIDVVSKIPRPASFYG